eukprot:233693-Pleurochrysis_carterae.AAC.1
MTNGDCLQASILMRALQPLHRTICSASSPGRSEPTDGPSMHAHNDRATSRARFCRWPTTRSRRWCPTWACARRARSDPAGRWSGSTSQGAAPLERARRGESSIERARARNGAYVEAQGRSDTRA